MKIPTRTEDRHAAADAADEAEGMARFLRGLTIGALVGAAIAGAAIWQRARNQVGQRTGYPSGPVDRTDDSGDDLPWGHDQS